MPFSAKNASSHSINRVPHAIRIYIDFERGGKQYTIIDTAGVRRRGKVDEAIEKFSVVKTLQAIEDANVVVLVVDARDQITEQDAHLADFVLQAGRALVLAVNKWDGLDEYKRDTIKRDIERKLHFLSFAKHHFISALNGTGMDALLKSVNQAYAAAMAKLPTPQLTRVLEEAIQKQQPPRVGVSAPRCAMPTRAAAIRRLSLSTAAHWIKSRTATAAIWKKPSAMHLS